MITEKGIENLRQWLANARKNESHRNHEQTRFWLDQYKQIAGGAVEALTPTEDTQRLDYLEAQRKVVYSMRSVHPKVGEPYWTMNPRSPEKFDALRACIDADMAIEDEKAAAFEEATSKMSFRVCMCDMRTKMVGDGCDVCNPELAAEIEADNAADEDQQPSELRSEIALVNRAGDVVSDWYPAVREGFLGSMSVSGIGNNTGVEQVIVAAIARDGSRFEFPRAYGLRAGDECNLRLGQQVNP